MLKVQIKGIHNTWNIMEPTLGALRVHVGLDVWMGKRKQHLNHGTPSLELKQQHLNHGTQTEHKRGKCWGQVKESCKQLRQVYSESARVRDTKTINSNSIGKKKEKTERARILWGWTNTLRPSKTRRKGPNM